MASAEEPGVTVTEAMGLLAECDIAETGCFASDPDAYLTMQGHFPDAGDGITTRRMAAAATDAGMAGIPLEEASYVTWKLVPDTAAIAAALAARPNRDPGHPSKIVDGPEARVIDAMGDETVPGNMRPQIMQCAYHCGRAGVGNCPVLLSTTEA